MCPACLASAAWMAGSVMSTAGLTALVVKGFHANETNFKERSNDNGDCDEREVIDESRAASRMAFSTQGIVNQGVGVHPAAR